MPLHYEGYYESRKALLTESDERLLFFIDTLYGRNNLPEGFTHDQLLAEALRQHSLDWTDTSSKEYEQVQFWTKVAKARLIPKI